MIHILITSILRRWQARRSSPTAVEAGQVPGAILVIVGILMVAGLVVGDIHARGGFGARPALHTAPVSMAAAAPRSPQDSPRARFLRRRPAHAPIRLSELPLLLLGLHLAASPQAR